MPIHRVRRLSYGNGRSLPKIVRNCKTPKRILPLLFWSMDDILDCSSISNQDRNSKSRGRANQVMRAPPSPVPTQVAQTPANSSTLVDLTLHSCLHPPYNIVFTWAANLTMRRLRCCSPYEDRKPALVFPKSKVLRCAVCCHPGSRSLAHFSCFWTPRPPPRRFMCDSQDGVPGYQCRESGRKFDTAGS